MSAMSGPYAYAKPTQCATPITRHYTGFQEANMSQVVSLSSTKYTSGSLYGALKCGFQPNLRRQIPANRSLVYPPSTSDACGQILYSNHEPNGIHHQYRPSANPATGRQTLYRPPDRRSPLSSIDIRYPEHQIHPKHRKRYQVHGRRQQNGFAAVRTEIDQKPSQSAEDGRCVHEMQCDNDQNALFPLFRNVKLQYQQHTAKHSVMQTQMQEAPALYSGGFCCSTMAVSKSLK